MGEGDRGHRGLRGRAAAALALLALAAAAGAVLHALRERGASRGAFPALAGRIAAPGASEPVEILRDAQGVPHVEAASESDAFFGLGFAHAQDRLAQMLWLRDVARGRTAERIGEDGLPADREARTLGLGRLADAQVERLDARTRRALDAYARGVNARITRIRDGRSGRPLVVRRLHIPLDDWRPADSLALVKLHAWALSGSLDASLVLDELIEHLGGAAARRFFPPVEGDPDAPLRVAERLPGPDSAPWVPDPLRRLSGLEGRSIGSSAWVVGREHTESGGPLLVADTHLEPHAPPFLYVAHVRGGTLDVAGATLPGVPVFWTGRNRRVAWASVHAGAVTVDLYREVFGGESGERYHDGLEWREVERRVEKIRIRGGGEEDWVVRSTRHGPLVTSRADEPPVALSWVGARIDGPSGIGSFLDVARAADADALVEVLARHHEPALTVVYADASGEAGLQMAGWLPRRALATGLVPLPGRARWLDWSDRIPFEELPRARLADGRGWLVAADNALPQPPDAARIEWLWRSGSRALRIDRLLDAYTARGPLDLRTAASLQKDVVSARARAIVDAALGVLADAPLAGPASEIAALLREWNGETGADSAGSAAYHVFLDELTRVLLGRELGDSLLERYLRLPQVDPDRVVLQIVSDAAQRTSAPAARASEVADVVRGSLGETWLRLSHRLGPNRRKWQWGRLHGLRFDPFGPPRRFVSDLPRLGPFPYGGSSDTVDASDYDPGGGGFRVRSASLFRFAIDAGNLEEALVSLAPGQSEHPGHPHFHDGLPGWLEGRGSLLLTSRLAVEATSDTRLVLDPAE